MSRPRGRAAPHPALLLLLVLAAAALAFEPNFDFYPKDARSCLLDAYTASKCQGDTAVSLNGCLCGNGGRFVLRTAQCLGKKDKKDVTAVYDTMTAACNTSKTPLQVDRDDFEEAAGGDGGKKTSSSSTATATTSTATKTSSSTATSKTASETTSSASSSASSASATATATTSSTASPAASPEHDRSRGGERRLSTGATIGIAAGVSIAGVGAIAALAFCLVRRRKRNTAPDESHPMLPPEKYVGAAGPPSGFPTPSPHELSPSLFRGGSGGFDHDAKSSHLSAASTYGGSPQNYAALPNASPDLHHQQQQHNFLGAWDTQTASATPYSVSPHSVQYVGPYAAPPQPVVAELPSQPRHVGHVFELDSQGTAAPAGASPPPPQPVLQQPILQQQPQPIFQQQQQQQQPILQQRASREYRPYIPQ